MSDGIPPNSPFADHVDLQRRFAPFDPATAGERDDLTFSLASYYYAPKTWADILASHCTVVLAEAGNGKTEELRYQAFAQRSAGKAAFFCRLELLAAMRLEEAIEIGSAAELTRWKDSGEKAWFFLDSVDEARLKNPRDFEVSIANFVTAIEPYKQRTYTVISTRPNAWQAYADREMLNRRLAIAPVANIAGSTSDTPSNQDGDECDRSNADGGAGDSATPSEGQAVLVLQLAPLNEQQVREFAKARRVTDIDEFVEAIERADADVFATRPADLPGLIELWKTQKRIGRYSEVVYNNVRLKLRETNPRHLHSTIAEDRALVGAEMLAAAVTLCRRTSILLPDQPVDASLKSTSLDPLEVLSGWTPSEVQALLGRALFDESLYGTVRFHHRTAREYLAARWFGRLLHKGKTRRSIERLLFGRPYGRNPEIAIPVMRSICGWLATSDQMVRDKTVKIDPCVLLEYGDASALDVGTRALLLREYARRYQDRSHTPISLNIREVRRLADVQLADDVRLILTSNLGHADVRELMLRIVREGRISACCDVAQTVALSDDMDEHTRSCAVQCIGVAGTSAQKAVLVAKITKDPRRFGRQVLASAIETLWPTHLTIPKIAALLSAAASPGISADHLDLQSEGLASRITSIEDKLRLLREMVILLRTPPLHDSNFCRISRRYDWLLTVGAKLAFDVIDHTSKEIDAAILAVFSMTQQADHLQRYTGNVEEEARQILQGSPSLRWALFWHEIEQSRAASDEPIREWWSSSSSLLHSLLTQIDISGFLDAAATKSKLDDRLVALSVLMTLWRKEGEAQGLLKKIRNVVRGDAELVRALKQHLKPRPQSIVLRQHEEQLALRREIAEKQKREREKNRKLWIESLRLNPDQVGDLKIASEGKVWKNTHWLLNELRKKEGDRNHWTTSQWKLLEPEFGPEVADAFRKFCQSFWRRYVPQLQSEGSGDSGVPTAVVVGLSGLAMEARHDSTWATKLKADEAKTAARYALLELNNLPEWFSAIHAAHTEAVDEILIKEICWELARDVSIAANYALARLRWSAQSLAEHLRTKIIELLSNAPTSNVSALTEALVVILRSTAPVPRSFARLAYQKARRENSVQAKALWIAALLALDAGRATEVLEKWVERSTRTDAEQKVTAVLNVMWGGDYRSINSQHRDYMRPPILLRLLRIAHTHIRIEDDISHDEAYSPSPRDHAQDARRHLLELLCGIPGQEAHAALIELSQFHTRQFQKDQMLVLADRRAEDDLQFDPWMPRQVVEFYDEADRNPVSQRDLFDLAYSRLDDLKLELEDGDESEASVVRRIAEETELRRLIANRLKQSARGKFTTGSEEELADRSRTDIRLHNPAVDARIPIEIKIAGRWTASQLVERLENQLITQYLREAKLGIFLIVNRAASKDRIRWKAGGSMLNFVQLLEWLQDQKGKVLKRHRDVQGIEIVGIDLSVRDIKVGSVARSRHRDRKRRVSTKTRKLGKISRRARRTAPSKPLRRRRMR